MDNGSALNTPRPRPLGVDIPELKQRLKNAVGYTWQARVRRVSRLRWLTKYNVLRRNGVRLREHPRRDLAFLLWDPEVESYTYDLDNLGELAAFVSQITGTPVDQVFGWVCEPTVEPWFNERWAKHVRWRFDAKRRLQLGNRHLWWVLVRATRPRLVVETGVHNGVGSVVLLAALARNRAEGFDGELLSIDTDHTAGGLVPMPLRQGWMLVHGTTSDVMQRALGDRRVDLMIHDTRHDETVQLHEFTTTLDHAAERVFLLDCGGGITPVLEALCHERGGRYVRFRDQPKHHFYVTRGTGVGVFPAPD